MAELDKKYPEFAPGRFLKAKHLDELSHIPKLYRQVPFTLRGHRGENMVVTISVVIVRISDERAAVMFVDNAARKIYGQRYLSGPSLDEQIHRFADGVISDMGAAYRREAGKALTAGKAFPPEKKTLLRIKQVIDKQVQGPLTPQDQAD
jgi:hypothetical protein